MKEELLGGGGEKNRVDIIYEGKTYRIEQVGSAYVDGGFVVYNEDGKEIFRVQNNEFKDYTPEPPVIYNEPVGAQEVTPVPQLTEEEAIAQGYTIIKTAEDLLKINDNLDGKYILMGDIDLSSVDPWIPIGMDSLRGSVDYRQSKYEYFTGTLNGNGYTISNMNISHEEEYLDLYGSSVGLFAGIKDATVENITIANSKIDLTLFPQTSLGISLSVGILAGKIESSNIDGVNIENCDIETKERGGKDYISDYDISVGLLAGYVSDGGDYSYPSIKNCNVSGNIAGGSYIGGLIGQSVRGQVENCTANVNITSGLYVGGLFGQNIACKETPVKNCTFTGTFFPKFDTASIGGVAGIGNMELYNSRIDFDVQGQFEYADIIKGGVAGICGYKHINSEIAFNDSSEIKTENCVINTDFAQEGDDNYLWGVSQTYPPSPLPIPEPLLEQVENQTVSNVTKLTEAEAIAQGYTIIKTLDDLRAIANNMSGKYILMNDIKMDEADIWEVLGSKDEPFTGILNGNGYNLIDFKLYHENKAGFDAYEPVGLFAYSNGAEFCNIGMQNCDMGGAGATPCAGSFVGEALNTKFTNCVLTSTRIGGAQICGGLAGKFICDDTVDPTHYVTNCSVSATSCEGICAQQSVGGLFGYVKLPYVGINFMDNCYADGVIDTGHWLLAKTASSIGGLIGYIEPQGAILTNCGFAGDIIFKQSYSYGSLDYYGLLIGNDPDFEFNQYLECFVNDIKIEIYKGAGQQPSKEEYIYIENSGFMSGQFEETEENENNETENESPVITNPETGNTAITEDPETIVIIPEEKYLAEIAEAAEKYHLTPTENPGVYTQILDTGEVLELVWNPFIKKFGAFTSKKSIGVGYDYKILEIFKQVYLLGYNFTCYLNIFEKNGIYYKYDEDTKRFIKLTDEEADNLF